MSLSGRSVPTRRALDLTPAFRLHEDRLLLSSRNNQTFAASGRAARLRRHVEGDSGFLDIKTAKTQLHHATLAGVEGRETVEGLVQGKDVDRRLGARDQMLVHRHVHRVPSPFRSLARTSDVDQDSPHQLGADCEEMCPTRPADSPNVDETDVQLVDETGRLKGGVRLFAGHVVVGQRMEFPVDERNQFVSRALLASSPGEPSPGVDVSGVSKTAAHPKSASRSTAFVWVGSGYHTR